MGWIIHKQQATLHHTNHDSPPKYLEGYFFSERFSGTDNQII